MAEHFGFFDAVQDANGNYDREYNAEQFTVPFDALVTNGIVRSAYEQLEVVTSGSNMISRVKSGVAFIEGHHYLNDGNIELTHDVEVLGLSRIDRVVIRKDSSPESRYVKAFIRKGVPSANPVPPTLTRNDYIYEISLAQVRVIGGQGFISSITDERGTVNIGPWAGSDILPSYDDNLLAQHVNNGNIHVTEAQKNAWNGAIQTSPNLIQGPQTNFDLLDANKIYHIADVSGAYNAPPESFGILITFANAVSNPYYFFQEFNSVSRNKYHRYYDKGLGVWSPWMKFLNQYDYDTLFQSVSNGKSVVANAITQKGVPTSATAEFATIAENISKLTGYATGSRTVTANGSLSVTGLTFEPKVVVAIIGDGASAGHLYIEKHSSAVGYIVEAFDASNQAGQPPTEFGPVWAKRKTDSDVIFTPTSFSIPIKSAATYTWHAYG